LVHTVSTSEKLKERVVPPFFLVSDYQTEENSYISDHEAFTSLFIIVDGGEFH